MRTEWLGISTYTGQFRTDDGRTMAVANKVGELSPERYRDFFDNTQDMLYVIDADGVVVGANRALQEGLGYSDKQLIGVSCWDFIHPRMDTRLNKEAWRVLKKEGRLDGFETEWCRLDGSAIDVSLDMKAEYDGKGNFHCAYVIARDITDHKKLEVELRESEGRYRRIVETANEGIWTIDAKGITTFVNARMAEMMGFNVDEMVGKPLLSFLDREGQEIIKKKLERRRKGVREVYEFHLLRRDGSDLWVLMGTSPLTDKDGRYAGSLAMITDINKRKDAENELCESEERFRQLAENIKEVFWMMTPDFSETLYISAGYEEVWGRTRESLYESPMDWTEAIHEDDRERVDEAAARDIANLDVEYRIVRPDGEIRWIHDRGFPVKDESGEVYRAAGIAEDITEQKQAEQELFEQKQAYEALFSKCPDGILVANLETKEFKYVNARVCQMFGYKEEEMCKLGVDDIHLNEDLPGAVAEFEALASGEKAIAESIPCLRNDGTVFFADISSAPVSIDGEDCMIGFLRDITESKQMKDELRLAHDTLEEKVEERTGELSKTVTRLKQEIEERQKAEHEVEEQAQTLQALFEESFDGIVVADAETRQIEYVNRASCQIFGYTKDEMQGMGIADLHPKEDLPRVFDEFEAQVKCEKALAESIPCQRKDNKVFHADINSTIAIIRSRRCFVGFYSDITERG